MEEDNKIEIHWQLDTELANGDSGTNAIVVDDFTEEDIKEAVECYLNSKDFIYNDVGEGDCVFFIVKVGLVPMSDERETLFAGVYFDHIVDWED